MMKLIKELKDGLESGKSKEEMAKELGVTVGWIEAIVSTHSYKLAE